MYKKDDIIKDTKFLIEKINESKSCSMKMLYYNELVNIIGIAEDNDLYIEAYIDNRIKNLRHKKIYNYCQSNFSSTIIHHDFYNKLSDNTINNLETKEKILVPKNYLILTKSEEKDIIFDFITKYNPNLYSWLKETYNRIGYFNNNISNNFAQCYFLPVLKKNYISINEDRKTATIENLSFLAHELGHSLHSKLLENQSSNIYYSLQTSKLIEVPSSTFELLFLNYLIEQKIDAKNALALIDHLLKELNVYMYNINIISHLNNYNIDNEGYITSSNEEKRRAINLVNTKYNTDFTIEDDIEYINSHFYGISILLSLYFSEMFKNNPKEAKKVLETYIMNIGNIDDYDMFNNFGFSSDILKNDDLVKKVLTKNYAQYKKELR